VRVKLILPALTEAKSPFFRPIKYSLFPPLGLATLAAYLDPNDEVTLQDEHVETLNLDDEPELVVIQVYITSAYRAYALADHYHARGATSASAGCTSPRCPRRRRSTLTASSSAPARTPGRNSSLTSAPARRGRSTARPRGRCSARRRCAAT
jgi:hypothetical protein